MPSTATTAFTAAALAAAAASAFFAAGRRRWTSKTLALIAELESARVHREPLRHDPRGLDGLPAPVRRYFRAVLACGQPIADAATIVCSGEFNVGQGAADRWRPFTSSQRVVTHRPGFVWDGQVELLPGLAVHVHDAYIAGMGLLHPTVAGWIDIGRLQGRGGIARDELMRFLAEAVWIPTALLPGQGVRWDAVDDRSARATLVDGDVSATLTFGFAGDGTVARVSAEARGRTVGGRTVPTPWEGRWWDYRLVDGMKRPFSGEVAWLLPQGRKPYWRGKVTALTTEAPAIGPAPGGAGG